MRCLVSLRPALAPALLAATLLVPGPGWTQATTGQPAPTATETTTGATTGTAPAKTDAAKADTAKAKADTAKADKGWLTDFLEKNLSGAGRKVTIDGFEGALSSQAKIQSLTIADDKGVWLTLKGVTLDWSRAALLTGKVEVNELTADEIDLPRLPEATKTTTVKPPSAQASSGFKLPELPISISIGKIEAKKVVLGTPVLGQAATLSVNGSARLAGGQGAAKLTLERSDGKTGLIALDASYANTTEELSLDLKVHEAAGGIVSTLAHLPDAPALALDVQGSGPLTNFNAKLRLATDGQPRVEGTLALRGATGPDGQKISKFTADLGGDMAPLFAPDYRAFFGTDTTVRIAGARLPSGVVELSTLDLKARQLGISGQVVVGADGMPTRVDLTGQLASGSGAPVLLPVPGKKTQVQHGALSVQYDAAKGDGWQGRAVLTGFQQPGMALGQVTLTGQGKIAPLAAGDTARGIEGTVDLKATGIAPAEKALATALGAALGAQVQFRYRPGGVLELPQIALTGDGFGLTGAGSVSGLQSSGKITGHARVSAKDITRFSGLAGRPLAGAATAAIQGKATLLTGAFDATASIDGEDLQVGVPQLDGLLKGASHVTLSASRDTKGTAIHDFKVTARSLSATAAGEISPEKTDLSADIAFTDLGQLGAGYGGSLKAHAALTGSATDLQIALNAAAQDLKLGQPMASRLMRGATTLTLKAHRTDGVIGIDDLKLSNPQIQASALPQGSTTTLAVKTRLSDLALLASGFSGPVTTEGTLGQTGKGYVLDLAVKGPGGIDTRIKGRVAADGTSADLSVTGGARAELVNPLISPRSVSGLVRFDLAMKGPFKLSSVSGTIAATGLKAAAPLMGVTATGGHVNVALGGNTARLTGDLQVGGGAVQFSGPIGLSAPFNADLGITAAHVGLKDPELFSTSANGGLTIKGPLAGGAAIAGRLTLGATELRVPATGADGSGAIPTGLVQKGASGPVLSTLKRAGLGPKPAPRDTSPPARPFKLDIVISAPSQVFVRGRGLDAELGGQVAMTGTTADIVPIGGFDLKRGRLEILGKRLDLTEGSLKLQGRFIPWVHLVASSTNGDVTANVNVDGDATDPKITFSSTPSLPQDEVLSQLLFGRGLSKISPFQAAQLAAAVATLAGKGGEGIVSKLRQGFGLDDLDIQTDAQGQASVKVGKYLTKNIYSDVTVGQDGTSQVDLNLDVTKSITLKGSAASDGNTGVGVYYQKDY